MGKKKMSLVPSSMAVAFLQTTAQTHSFRSPGDDNFKTVNSIYNRDAEALTATTPPEPYCWFTNSSNSASFSSTVNSDESGGDEFVENVIRGLRSDRLFFEPHGVSNSILEEAKAGGGVNGDYNELLFKESVVLAIESEDPYGDFRRSMEEMVEAHGLKNWEYLEELLYWYLRVDGKKNHGFIVGAFVDLLIGLAANSTTTATCSSSSSSSSSSSNYCSTSLSSLECVEEK